MNDKDGYIVDLFLDRFSILLLDSDIIFFQFLLVWLGKFCVQVCV